MIRPFREVNATVAGPMETANIQNATMTTVLNSTLSAANATIATTNTSVPIATLNATTNAAPAIATNDSVTMATLSNITSALNNSMDSSTTTMTPLPWIADGQFLGPETTTSSILNSIFNTSLNATALPSNNASTTMMTPFSAGAGCLSNHTVIWNTFGQCVVTPVQVAGFVLGLVSILAWVVAHSFYIRAVRIDYRHSPARISLLGLSLVLTADFLNFAGAVTSNQLSTMVTVAVYLLVMDFVRFVHSFLLRVGGKQWCYDQVTSRYQERWDKFFLVCPWLLSAVTYVLSPSLLELGRVEWQPARTEEVLVHRSRILLQTDEFESPWKLMNAGYIMGVLMVPLYMVAVIPDLIKVFQCRRSTPHMVVYYVAAIVADCLYLASIYTQDLSTDFLLHTLPWTVARTGVCGLHMGVLVQICIARGSYMPEEEVRMSLLSKRVDDSDDETLFERDSGLDITKDEMEMEDIPKRNRYIKKMRKIGEQIDGGPNPFSIESSDDDLSDDEQTSLVPNRKSRDQVQKSRGQRLTGPLVVLSDRETDSDVLSLSLDLEPDTLSKPLSEDEITKLLESEYHLDHTRTRDDVIDGRNDVTDNEDVSVDVITGSRSAHEEFLAKELASWDRFLEMG